MEKDILLISMGNGERDKQMIINDKTKHSWELYKSYRPDTLSP